MGKLMHTVVPLFLFALIYILKYNSLEFMVMK